MMKMMAEDREGRYRVKTWNVERQVGADKMDDTGNKDHGGQ